MSSDASHGFLEQTLVTFGSVESIVLLTGSFSTCKTR